jgi:hypothetical protein
MNLKVHRRLTIKELSQILLECLSMMIIILIHLLQNLQLIEKKILNTFQVINCHLYIIDK